MNEQENNWFYRNRTFFFGFSIVLVVLLAVITVLVPQQTPFRWSGEATEYAVDDEGFAEKRTVTLFPLLVSAPEKLRFAICFAVWIVPSELTYTSKSPSG